RVPSGRAIADAVVAPVGAPRWCCHDRRRPLRCEGPMSALFPTLTSPVPFPPSNLPYSSLAGLGSARAPIVKLGALSPEARSRANATISRLSDLSLGLERDLARLVNRGDAPPGTLPADIASAANEVVELEAHLSEVDSDTALTRE